MRYLILTLPLFLSLTLNLNAQDLNRRIDISFHAIPLDSALRYIQQKYKPGFSFAFDDITGKTRISIRGKQKTLYSILQEIARQTNLEFVFIGDIIVFRNGKQAVVGPTMAAVDSIEKDFSSQASDNHIPDSVRTITTILNNSMITKPSVLPVIVPAFKPAIPRFDMSSTALAKKQLDFSRWGIIFNANADRHQYRFKSPDVDFQKFDTNTNYSVGLGVFYRVTPKLYLATAINWTRKNFTLHYNYNLFDPNDPFPIPNTTKEEYQFLEIPLALAVPVLTGRKSSLLVVVAGSMSKQTINIEKTSYLNHADAQTNYFNKNTASRLYSGSVGLIASHQLIKSSGLFVAPSFLLYSKALSADAMKSATTAFRLTAGVHYKFCRT